MAIAASEVVRIALKFVTYLHVHSLAMAPLGVARVARTSAPHTRVQSGQVRARHLGKPMRARQRGSLFEVHEVRSVDACGLRIVQRRWGGVCVRRVWG